MGEFSRTSPWRAYHQWLLSHALPCQYSPTLQFPRKRCHGIQVIGLRWLLGFWQATPPGQITLVAGRASPSSTDILVCWIPWIQSSFSNVPGATSTWGTIFMATTWATLTPMAKHDWSGTQVFHHNYNSLAPGSHLGIGIHDTQAIRQAGSITPFQGLHDHVHVVTQKYGLCSSMYDVGQKSIYYLLYHFNSHI